MNNDFVNDTDYINNHQYRNELLEIMSCIDYYKFDLDEAKFKNDRVKFDSICDKIIKESLEKCDIASEDDVKNIISSQIQFDE